MKANSRFPRSKNVLAITLFLFATLTTPWVKACRIETPPTTSLQTITSANNAFGLKLYRQLVKSKASKNQFFSPISIFAALAMTSEGAAGTSLEIFKKTLGLPDAQTTRTGLKELFASFSVENAPYALVMANAIWPEATAKLKAEFLQTVKSVYLGESKPLDFKHNPEVARTTINAWVEQKTNTKIKDLLPAGSIDASVRMVLTNAIYFKGKWKYPFKKSNTQEETFTLDGGKDVERTFMHMPYSQAKLRYTEIEEAQWVELPYVGGELSMVLMLPPSDEISVYETKFNVTQWQTVRSQLQYNNVNVWLPKFKMAIGGSIVPELKALGMGPVFSDADFSNMFSQGGTFAISDVIHKAFVEVNEAGTEAAAATAVVNKATSAIPQHEPEIFNFRADHPFLFIIQQNKTGNILFMGKVMNPMK